MVPWLVLIGILLIPTAGFLLWSWRGSRNDLALMRATETTRAADVAKLPVGSLVEVKGRLRCASPVIGELSKSPCAHFVTTVERDYEVWEYDAKRQTSYRVRKTEVTQSNTLFAPFEIEDGSGRAAVSAADAIIEGIESVARQHAHELEEGNGSVMQAAFGNVNAAERTLGFRYRETYLPLDAEIYVLGVVGANRCIGAPPVGAKWQRFLISVHSEEARAAELGTKTRWLLALGVLCLMGAVACRIGVLVGAGRLDPGSAARCPARRRVVVVGRTCRARAERGAKPHFASNAQTADICPRRGTAFPRPHISQIARYQEPSSITR